MTEHPRVAALVARHAVIDAAMRDLPIYNPALGIEAWGFSPFDRGMLLGVLITPWFMNLVLLPEAPEPLDSGRYGSPRKFTLPAGERVFRYAGDAEIGAYWTASLHSPMAVFKSAPQARAEARLRLLDALTPPEPEPRPEICPSRRAFLAGGRTARS